MSFQIPSSPFNKKLFLQSNFSWPSFTVVNKLVKFHGDLKYFKLIIGHTDIQKTPTKKP